MNKNKLGELFYQLFLLGLIFILLCGTIYSAMLLLLFVLVENFYKIALCAFGFCIILSLFYFISVRLDNKITIIKITPTENRKYHIIIFIIIYAIILFLLYLFRILPDFPKEGITPS